MNASASLPSTTAAAPAAPPRSALRTWAVRGVLAAVALALVVGLALWARSLLSTPAAPKKQVAKISLLPDTPPPPPPPPKVEKPPEPKEPPKQLMREETPRPAEAPKPADAPLKMDGPAGDGPSAFQAGTVAREYQGGAPVVGGQAAARPAADRSQARFYANNARQSLSEELDRRYTGDASTLVAEFSLWVAADGSLQRYELKPTGDTRRDNELRAALDATLAALRLPPPPDMPQPLRFRVNIRGAG